MTEKYADLTLTKVGEGMYVAFGAYQGKLKTREPGVLPRMLEERAAYYKKIRDKEASSKTTS